MHKQHVLFVCYYNSAGSVMAEAMLNKTFGEHDIAHSAGIEPGPIDPLVVEVMKEEGIDISGHQPQNVFEVIKEGLMFADVITVCDESHGERCPIFPGVTRRLHWNVVDPSEFEGSREEKLAATRELKDSIKARINDVFSVENPPFPIE